MSTGKRVRNPNPAKFGRMKLHPISALRRRSADRRFVFTVLDALSAGGVLVTSSVVVMLLSWCKCLRVMGPAREASRPLIGSVQTDLVGEAVLRRGDRVV